MLSLPPSVRVFVATQPIDGPKGADSLMVIVRDVFEHDPLGGHLFVFFSKRCDRVRIVYWDRNGFAMWTKRAARGDCDRGRRARADHRGARSPRRTSKASMGTEKNAAGRTFTRGGMN
ncbi:hypothetical protein BH09MYX1_BH09MYX1_67340 [soil metagenome]